MGHQQLSTPSCRYRTVSGEKADGLESTPKILADFVADQIVRSKRLRSTDNEVRILDPAVGQGELLISLLERLPCDSKLRIKVIGFETNADLLNRARERLFHRFPDVEFEFENGDFLEHILDLNGAERQVELFSRISPEAFDIVIANPPYVRTQIIGAKKSQSLALNFGLSGRVDLYHAFILAISTVLKPMGVAGIIVSNRFMTTKSGAPVRQALLERFSVRSAWDLGDTKLFDSAVLPAVLLVEGKNGNKNTQPSFTSIYQTSESPTKMVSNPLSALSCEGVVEIEDGRRFSIRRGRLHTSGNIDGVWRIATDDIDAWLDLVKNRSWGTFGDIGKIRVGVKTCADKVFIRNDWSEMPAEQVPELLKQLTTHHIARRFRALSAKNGRKILYPHMATKDGRSAIDLSRYPKSLSYLERHREVLETRRYVIESGRNWYEIWVPQDPAAWVHPKLVFRDISEQPTFWIDLDGTVVNGDCYWLVARNPKQVNLLWLAAAVANSTFIERYYDLRFNNKLYAGRRRFITQYVEKFPLPDPNCRDAKAAVDIAKHVYDNIDSPSNQRLQEELDALVWRLFTGGGPA